MTWTFAFEAGKPNRLRRYFMDATVWDRQEPTMWWSYEFEKFVPDGDEGTSGASSHSPRIRTLRAFKRFLRRHPELQGRQVLLVNRYIGFNVTATYSAP